MGGRASGLERLFRGEWRQQLPSCRCAHDGEAIVGGKDLPRGPIEDRISTALCRRL
jgi:hypothetical protein